MYWEAVPNTWPLPGSSEAYFAKCVVRDLSVGERIWLELSIQMSYKINITFTMDGAVRLFYLKIAAGTAEGL